MAHLRKTVLLRGIVRLVAAVMLASPAAVSPVSVRAQAPEHARQWVGTIQRAITEPSGATLLTLEVTQAVASSGTVTDVTPPKAKTVRVPRNAPMIFATASRKAVAADLDFGARVTVSGAPRPGGAPIEASLIEIRKTASEAMGDNLLSSPNDPKSWWPFFNAARAEGSLEADAGEPEMLRMTVRKTAGTDWHAHIFRNVALKPGKTYTLRFLARADVPRLITADSQVIGEGYRNAGLYRVIPLTATWRAFRTVFRAASGVTAAGADLKLLFGGQTGVVRLADMSLVEGDCSVPAGARAVPGARTGLLVLPNEPNCWMLKAVPPADAVFIGSDKTLKVTVTKLDDPKYVWGSQLFQMVDLEAGRAYTITFLAKADAPRRLGVWARTDNGRYRRTGLEASVTLGTEWKFYTLTFTAVDPEPGHTKAPCFCFGESLGTVWLSNVTLTPEAAVRSPSGPASPVR